MEPSKERTKAVSAGTMCKPAEEARARPTQLVKGRSRQAVDRGKGLLSAALIVFSVVLSAFGQPSNAPQHALPTLTTAHAAHSLPFDEAKRGYPVHLRAVVTYYDPDTDPRTGAFFACDASGCIAVLVPPRTILPLRPGNLVDLNGVSAPGGYAPVVIKSAVQVVGQSHLPANPQRRSLAQLLTGADDCHWVEVEGVVHSVSQSGPHVTITLALRDGTIRGITLREAGADYARLVDARVVIQGNIAPVFTKNRQMVGARLLFSSLAQVRVEEPAPADPFSLPVSPINSLLRFAPDVTFVHRVRVRGQVTLQWPGQWLFIQDGTQGLFIPTVQKTPLQLGDVVEVVGFPAMGEYTLMLEDAVFKPEGPGPAVAAAPVTAQDAMKGVYDAKLIQIQGRLVNQDLNIGQTSENPTLVMSSGGMVFLAVLPIGTEAAAVASWRVGSELRLTGVCSVQVDKYLSAQREGAAQPKSFRVLLRSPQDVMVLQKPSWWTAGRILVLLAICLLTMVFGTVWVASLRRRIQERTETIRATLESTADGILVVNSAGRTVAYNQKCVTMWAVPEPIVWLRNHGALSDLVQSQLKAPEAFIRKVRAVAADPTAQTDDVLECKDGRVFECHSEPQTVRGMYVGRVWGFRDVTERKRAEEALRESEQFNREVIASAQEGVVVYDRDCRYQVWNRFMEELTGVPVSELLGKNAFDLFPHLREQGLDLMIRRALAGEVVHTPDTPFRVPTTGKAGWVSNVYSPHVGASGEILGVIGIIRDVTERKRAEEALQLSGYQLAQAMDLALLAHWEFNPATGKFTFNDRFYALYGTTAEREGGYEMSAEAYAREFLYPEDVHIVADEIAKSLVSTDPRAASALEHRIRRRDGEMRHIAVRISMIRNSEGVTIKTRGVNQDITERKRAEEALRASEQRYKDFIAHSQEGVWRIEAEQPIPIDLPEEEALESFMQYGYMAECNLAHARIMGFSTIEEMVGKGVGELVPPSDEGRVESYRAAIRGGFQSTTREFRTRDKSGDLRHFLRTEIPIVENRMLVRIWGITRDITERKRAEEAHAYLASIVQSSDDGIIGKSPEGIIQSWNAGAERLYGYTAAEVIGQSILLVVPPERREEVMGFLNRIKQGGEIEHHETVRVRKDGRRVDVSITISPLKNASGEVVGASTIARDITERKRAEEALRESEAELAAAQRIAHLGSWHWNIRTDTVHWSDETFRIYGQSPSPLDNHRQAFQAMIHPDDRMRADRAMTDALNGTREYDIEYRIQLADGSEKVIHSQGEVVKDEAGNPLAVRGIDQDVTARVRAEEAVRWASAYNRRLLEASLDPLVTIAPDGKITDVNNATEKVTGLPRQQLIGTDFSDYFTDSEKARARYEQVFREGLVQDFELEIRRRDGHVTPVLYKASVYRGETGDVIGVIAAARDITERKRAEEEQQRSFEQLRALAARLESIREEERKRLAREIHDELGQALTAIKIDLSSLVRDLPADKKQPFEPILKEVDDTVASVRKISTELRPGILDVSGLVGAIEWAADEFESRTGIKCRLDLPQDEIAIGEERATALFRIFQETLTNIARHADATEVYVRLAKEDGSLVLDLQDNGKGITEEQVAAGGSLGILGMRERALLLGGKLTVRGAPGKGTTVEVRLPQTLHKQAGAGS